METSAKTNENVDHLFESMAKDICRKRTEMLLDK